MKKLISFIICLYIFSTISYSQQLYQKYYFTSPTDKKISAFVNPDSSIIIARQTIIGGKEHFQLIKANNNGDTLWTNTNFDTLINHFYCMTKGNNGWLIAGMLISADSVMHGTLIKLDTSFNIVWQRIYSDTIVNSLSFVKQMNDGNLILGGFLSDYPYLFNSGGSILKCDSAGNLIWHNFNMLHVLSISDAMETSEHGYIVSGNYKTDITWLQIEQIDSSGNRLRGILADGFTNGFTQLTMSADSTFMIGGLSTSYNDTTHGVVFARVNNSTGTFTSTIYPVANLSEVNTIVQTSDKGFLISGMNRKSFYKSEINIIKFDSSFNMQWNKTISNYSLERGSLCLEESNNRFVILGNVDSYDHAIRGFSITGFDASLILSDDPENKSPNKNCEAFPNPFHSSTTIVVPGDHSKLRLLLFDVCGRLVKTINADSNSFHLERENLMNGFYFYKIQSINEHITEGRLVVD